MTPTVRVGVSGWSYRDWNGCFYPPGLAPDSHLSFIAEHFNTVEVNRSFYSLLQPDVYRSWYRTVPSDFVFSVKGSRYITHQKKLHDVTVPLANFLASGVLHLTDKLGPFLWQLSGEWSLSLDRILGFLKLLPASFEAAVDLAARHNNKVKEASWPEGSRGRIRHVLEVRHPQAPVAELTETIEDLGMALAVSDAVEWPRFDPVESDFVYVRLHGPRRLYDSAYDADELDRWAERIDWWRKESSRLGKAGGECFVYFDNDGHAAAPRNAMALAQRFREMSGAQG
jgi:uncharacterized protein YecE (DUF72 family)